MLDLQFDQGGQHAAEAWINPYRRRIVAALVFCEVKPRDGRRRRAGKMGQSCEVAIEDRCEFARWFEYGSLRSLPIIRKFQKPPEVCEWTQRREGRHDSRSSNRPRREVLTSPKG
jgi:hypothetical protein